MRNKELVRDELANEAYDAVVIGAGFYGSMVALYLSESRGFKRIALLEREDDIMLRASLNNQARVHNGYHYPRSFSTAARSRASYSKFNADWSNCLDAESKSYYAIARQRSKIAPNQFESITRATGAPLANVTEELSGLFDMRRIEAIYRVDEITFDSKKIAKLMRKNLSDARVDIVTNVEVDSVDFHEPDLVVGYRDLISDDSPVVIKAKYVFNCSYAGIDSIRCGRETFSPSSFKFELTEMGLYSMPKSLAELGITVMDGPFFSTLPWPSRPGLHTLSHVRLTPIASWRNGGRHSMRTFDRLIAEAPTRSEIMLRDAARYVPELKNAEYVESIHEIKTVLMKNEVNDGRPIYFEKSSELPGLYTVLGGKLDNIYDVISRLDQEDLRLQ